MPADNEDLHGNVPDRSPVVLLIVDMINDLEFEGGEMLLGHALPVAERIAALKARARAVGIPVVYANDNFGRWRSDFREVVERCQNPDVRGHPLAQLLSPDEDDYFVLKPKHSAFFKTTLETLLEYLEAKRLILTGITGDICVLLTAGDAYMRDLRLHVPADCVASIDEAANQRALDYMKRVFGAEVEPSDGLDLNALRG
jgi:nicotinamidase-related amidase